MHLKSPTIPFRIVACTFSDNLSQNSCIHFLDERDLLTTELSDFNDLCFETCILEGTSYVTDRILRRMANGRQSTISTISLTLINAFSVSFAGLQCDDLILIW